MPTARYKTTINASFDRVSELLADKVEKPRKYVGVVVHSKILERGDGYVIREMLQAMPVQLTVREKIYEKDVPGGRDFVFEHIDNARYTGFFHNILTRVEGREDHVELEYFMDWRPHPGTQDDMPEAAAQQLVKQGVEHMKEIAEHPVVVPDWVRAFFDAADSLDADALEPLLADDMRFRVGNNPEVVGKGNVIEASRGVTQVFSAMQHDYVGVYTDNNRAFADCFVDYTALNGDKYLIPFLTMLEQENGKISSVVAYGDMSPVRHGW